MVSKEDNDNEVTLTQDSFVPNYDSPIQGTNEGESTSTKFEAFLFCTSGMAATLAPLSILSCLVYYDEEYGKLTFPLLNLMVFSPLLPLSITQSMYDLQYDIKYGSRNAFVFRMAFGTIFNFTILLMPIESNLPTLLFLAFIIGTSGAIIQGVMVQIASLVTHYHNDSGFPVAVTAGFQLSGIVIVFVSIFSQFGADENDGGIYTFYGSIFVLNIFAALSFIWLLFVRKIVTDSMFRRDNIIQIEPSTERLLTSDNLSGENFEDEDTECVQSYSEIFESCKYCCYSILITVASSMVTGSYFSEVNTDWDRLPQVLFFTRMFFDFIGRPAAFYIPINSDYKLLVFSLIRLSFVPIYFLAAAADWFPSSDELLISLVAFFAFTSGHFVATAHRISPQFLPEGSEAAVTKQSSLLNVYHAAAINIGVVIGIVVVSVL